MFRQLNDFLAAYETLTEGTQKLLEKLENGHLDQVVIDGHRTLGQIEWHIVVTIPEMMNHTGLGLGSVDLDALPPASANEIAAGYRAVSSELLHAVKASWNDESLLETDDMYGETWPRGKTLAMLVHHEIHHRAQMTLLMRQAGLAVPGLFGPSKEEWSGYGMDLPAY